MSDSSLYKCPNCGKFYDKNFHFCPHCGQKHEEKIFTFKELLSDFLGSLFSFDSKAFNSLPKLIFRPGKLTVDYLSGKRVSNLSPFRMYLFFSVVLFLLLPFIIKEDKLVSVNDEVVVREKKKKLDNLFITIQDSLAVIEELENGREVQGVPGMTFSLEDSTSLKKWKSAAVLIENGASVQSAVDSIFTDNNKMAKFALKQALKVNAKNGRGLIGVFLNSLSYSLFLFLPLFALVLKLLYIRRRRFYVEHFIFSLHVFSFIFFILIVWSILVLFKCPLPKWIPLAVIFIYLLLALKTVYQQSWKKTILKYIAVFFTNSLLLLPLVFVIAILVSFIFY